MMNECKKCGRKNEKWISGKTFQGLEEHHNPPEYMDCYDGDVCGGKEYNRKYEYFTLCRECHTGKTGLHKNIILPYLNKIAGLLKINNSEQWIWNNLLTSSEKYRAREEIIILSKIWVEDGDTKTA